MKINLVAMIKVHELDLRDHRAFHACAEFSRHSCTITLDCIDTGQSIVYNCNHDDGAESCWGWRYFKHRWEQKYGPL